MNKPAILLAFQDFLLISGCGYFSLSRYPHMAQCITCTQLIILLADARFSR